jgi:regulatory protein
MGKQITALKAQKRNHQRVNVFLDGEFAFGLSRIVAAWLHVGQELSTEKIEELKLEDELDYAYQRAIRYIGYRMRSVYELQNYLNQQGIENQVIERVIIRLQKKGLLDDLNFAQMWIENRNSFRPRSHRMLSFELKQKGIQSDIISQILEETISEEDLAYRAAKKQARKYKQLEWQIFRRRLSSFLARRGFPYSVINPAVDQVWSEQNIDRTEVDRETFGKKS